MSYTLSTFSQAQVSSGAVTVTIAIPAGAAVGISVMINAGFGLGYFQGTLTDTGGNTYIAAGGANAGGTTEYCDAFYCLNTTSSATSLTYTPNAGYTGVNLVFSAAWAWTVSGTPIFGSQSNNFQSAPGTGTDAVTSGSVTCATGSVIMGFNSENGSSTYTVGTGFTQDFNNFGSLAEHGSFSSPHAATWTSSLGTEGVISQAISFGIQATAGIAFMGQILM